MTYSSRKNLQGLFFTEATGYHLQIKDILLGVAGQEGILSVEDAQELHRLFHNIKGAAAQVDLPDLSEAAWIVEVILEDIAYHSAPFTTVFSTMLSALSATIYDYCTTGVSDPAKEAVILDDTKTSLRTFLHGEEHSDWPNSTTLCEQELAIEPVPVSANETDRLVQLLHKYSTILVQENGEFDDAVIEEVCAGISTLSEYARRAGFVQREFLLAKFSEFLDNAQSLPLVVQKEILPLINQLFEFLELVEDTEDEVSKSFIVKITTELSRVGESLGFSLTIQEPVIVEEKGDILPFPHQETDLLLSEEEDFLSVDDDLFDNDLFIDDEPPLFANESESGQETIFTPVVEELGEDDESSLEEIFYAECEEHIATINMSMLVIDQGGDNEGGIRTALAEMRRAIHTLKGAAGMTGFTDLSSFAHLSEDFLDELYDRSVVLDEDIVTLLSEIVRVIEALAYTPDTVDQSERDTLQTEIDAQLLRIKESHQPAQPAKEGVEEKVQSSEPESVASGPTDNVLVQLEKIDELQVLGGDIVTTRNAMVGFLDDLNQTLNELEIAKEKLRKISNELDEGFEIQALHGFGAGTSSQSGNTATEESEFDVMELDRYSELSLIIRSLNETSVDLGSVHSSLLQASGNIRGQLSRQELTTRVNQNRLMRIRMTPLSSVSRVFFQNVRSTAKDLGKKVQLHIDGEDVYLDRFIWKKISDPIMHILRNSIDHGIETKEQRAQAQKPEQGSITIQTIQRGNAVVLRIFDDGAGIDIAKLEKTLLRKNIIPADHKLSPQQLLQYLFHTGITTKDEVSMVSGRGVGLDVVYKNIQELKGSVLVHTEDGKGTTFEINVPISLSINKGIIISDHNRLFAIPLQDIEEVISYSPEETGAAGTLLWRGETVEKVDLQELVGTGEHVKRADKQLAVICASGSKYKAVVIDFVKKQQEIVVKNLGSHLKKVIGISGVTDLGDGNLIPILDLVELTETDRVTTISPQVMSSVSSENESLNILVVDDSISVRQSVMRLLKSQGWTVALAKDGVEGLEKLQGFHADLIISDIEMPRMNGYEFKESLNNSERLQKIPVVMLTSRVSSKHKQKAEDLGIQKFVTKPYKDEEFIGLVQQLAVQAMEVR